MNNELQAKNGFKTFIITLSVSLLVFGALYYTITGYSADVDIENDTEVLAETTTNTETEMESVFGPLASDSLVDTSTGPQVLAETDDVLAETTEATTPATGSETLAGTAVAIMLFSIALYYVVSGPRKLALAKFEESVIE